MSISVVTLCSTCFKLTGVLSHKLNTTKIYKLTIKLQTNMSNIIYMVPQSINTHEKEHTSSSKLNLFGMNDIMNLKSEKLMQIRTVTK
jgi:hypothetical protein